MAENDIRPYSSVHGGVTKTGAFALGTATAFNVGEPVRLDVANGNVVGCTTIPVAADILGIAASPGTTTGTRLTFRQKMGQFTPGTGLPVAGDLVMVWLVEPTQSFITANFGTTTGAFGITPATAHVGLAVGLELVSTTWGVNSNSSTKIGRILEVLDSEFYPIHYTGRTGKWVVFSINAHETTATGVVADTT